MNTYMFSVVTYERVYVTAKDDDEAYELVWNGDWNSAETFNTEYQLEDIEYGEENDSNSNQI